MSSARPPPSSSIPSPLTRRIIASSANRPPMCDKVTFHESGRAGTTKGMGSLGVLFVPGALLLVSVLLFVTAWLEDNVLSPRSLILHTVRTRSRRIRPEDVERLVALESERLLRELERRVTILRLTATHDDPKPAQRRDGSSDLGGNDLFVEEDGGAGHGDDRYEQGQQRRQ